jgi:hypothetical protein
LTTEVRMRIKRQDGTKRRRRSGIKTEYMMKNEEG